MLLESPVIEKTPLIAQSLGVSTTTLGPPVGLQKLSLATPATLPLGDYILRWSYAWHIASITAAFMARIQLDNTGGALGSFANLLDHLQIPTTAGVGTVVQVAAGDIVFTGLSGAHAIDLDFGASDGTSTAYIFRARMILEGPY